MNVQIFIQIFEVYFLRFSVNQIASFKEIEKEFSRERSSQYIVRAHIKYIISILVFFQ